MILGANPSSPTARQILRITLIGLAVFVLNASLFQTVSGQCVDHPDKKTALKFANESGYDLTFFVDDDEAGVVVASKTVSMEQEVGPGEHLLRARAIIRDAGFWVWVVNDVPEGQVCTWTIEDPPSKPGRVNYRYRSSIDLKSTGPVVVGKHPQGKPYWF